MSPFCKKTSLNLILLALGWCSTSLCATGLFDLGYVAEGPVPNEHYASGIYLGLNFAIPWSEQQFWGIRGSYLWGQNRVDENNKGTTAGSNPSKSDSADSTSLFAVFGYYRLAFATTPVLSPFVELDLGMVGYSPTCPKNAAKNCIGNAPPSQSSFAAGVGLGVYFSMFRYFMPYLQFTKVQTSIDGMRDQNIFLFGINYNGVPPEEASKAAGGKQ